MHKQQNSQNKVNKSINSQQLRLDGEKMSYQENFIENINNINVQEKSNEEINSLNEKIQKLNKQIQKEQDQNKKILSQKENLQQKNKRLQQQIEEKQQENKNFQEQNKILQDQIENLQQNKEQNNICEGHLETIEHYKQQCEKFKSKLYFTEQDLESVTEKYENLSDQIDKLKNRDKIGLVKKMWQYEIVECEILENLERLVRQKEIKMQFQVQTIADKEREISKKIEENNKLQNTVSDLNFEIEVLKNKGQYASMFTDLNQKNFKDIGQEIIALKSTIDGNINNLAHQDKLQNLEVQLKRLEQINERLNQKIKDIEWKQQLQQSKYSESKILQQLEQAEIKLKNDLQCSRCKSMPNKPVTCIPCGHSYCKKCYYDVSSNLNKDKDGNPQCQECGKESNVSYVYRNDYIEDMIEMFIVLKTAKDSVQQFMLGQAGK